MHAGRYAGMQKPPTKMRLLRALGVFMFDIEFRQIFRTNGLIDDFVVTGKPQDYLNLAEKVNSVITSGSTATITTRSHICIEVSIDSGEEEPDLDTEPELFTSLQSEGDDYFTIEEWGKCNILRVIGNKTILNEFRLFLIKLSGLGEGYSYLSEYSEKYQYSEFSPEWRLNVDVT